MLKVVLGPVVIDAIVICLEKLSFLGATLGAVKVVGQWVKRGAPSHNNWLN